MLYSTDQTATFPRTTLRYVRATLQDHVLTITLARPAKKNALHPPMLNELAFALAYAHHTPDVWVVVLAAEGDVFCAGMDLGALRSDDVENTAPAGPVRLGELMAGLHKPCVARVQGGVYAGGFLLVGGATHVVAVEEAKFALPEVRRGLFPFQVLAVLLNVMPQRTALDLCLRAPTLLAQEAQRLGLVTDVVPADRLDAAVQDVVNTLKLASPVATQFGLRAAQALRSLPPDQQQAFLFEQFRAIQQTADAQEGIQAFKEKRPPNWTGQ